MCEREVGYILPDLVGHLEDADLCEQSRAGSHCRGLAYIRTAWSHSSLKKITGCSSENDVCVGTKS